MINFLKVSILYNIHLGLKINYFYFGLIVNYIKGQVIKLEVVNSKALLAWAQAKDIRIMSYMVIRINFAQGIAMASFIIKGIIIIRIILFAIGNQAIMEENPASHFDLNIMSVMVAIIITYYYFILNLPHWKLLPLHYL